MEVVLTKKMVVHMVKGTTPKLRINEQPYYRLYGNIQRFLWYMELGRNKDSKF